MSLLGLIHTSIIVIVVIEASKVCRICLWRILIWMKRVAVKPYQAC